MTELQFEKRAEDAFHESWAEYECESLDTYSGEFNEIRSYHVDDELVVAITDEYQEDFISCYHKHFDGKGNGHHAVMTMPVGDRRLKYRQVLQEAEDGTLIRKVKRHRGF